MEKWGGIRASDSVYLRGMLLFFAFVLNRLVDVFFNALDALLKLGNALSKDRIVLGRRFPNRSSTTKPTINNSSGPGIPVMKEKKIGEHRKSLRGPLLRATVDRPSLLRLKRADPTLRHISIVLAAEWLSNSLSPWGLGAGPSPQSDPFVGHRPIAAGTDSRRWLQTRTRPHSLDMSHLLTAQPVVTIFRFRLDLPPPCG